MRLLTRFDFDGLACSALLKELGIIDSYKFVHPKDIQDGLIDITDDDVLVNVPYVKGCKLWFNHHTSESSRIGAVGFEGESRAADSAARVVYEYYNGSERIPHMEEMICAVDKIDSANLTKEEIFNPSGWVLFGIIMDPRTGLGRFQDFRIPNYNLIEYLVEECRRKSIDEIMANPDVRERVALYFDQDALFHEMIAKHTRTDGNIIITDLRGVDPIYSGNRFIIYSLYPEQNISMWVVDAHSGTNCLIAVGHSIFNKTSKTDVGELMLLYGGGGHPQAGTCQVARFDANRVIGALTNTIKADG